MKNIGKNPSIVEKNEISRNGKTGFLSNKGGKIKKKVKSKKPLQLPNNYHQQIENSKLINEILNDPEKRMQERIRRQKMRFLDQELSKENLNVQILNKQDVEMKQKLILEIANYKDE